jgi:hypothetical protein
MNPLQQTESTVRNSQAWKTADILALGAQSDLINNEIFPTWFLIFELPDPDGTMG